MNHPLIRNYREGRIDLRRLNSSQRAVLAAVLDSELASAEEKKLRALGALATMSKIKLAAQRASTNVNYVYRARRIQQHDTGLLWRVLDGQLSLTEAERQLAKHGKGLPKYQAPEERTSSTTAAAATSPAVASPEAPSALAFVGAPPMPEGAVGEVIKALRLGAPDIAMEYEGTVYYGWRKTIDLRGVEVSPYRQRKLREKRVKEIMANYYPPAVNVNIVIRPEGTHGLAGGQHCGEASVRLGVFVVPATVWLMMTPEEERKYCRLLNEVDRGTTDEKVASLLAEGDPELTRLLQLLRSQERDWRLNGQTWEVCRSPLGLLSLTRKLGEKALVEALRLGNDAWRGKKEASLNYVIYGLAYLVTCYRTAKGEFPWGNVARMLARIEYPASLKDGMESREWFRSGDLFNEGRQLARYIAEVYNKQHTRKTTQLVAQDLAEK